jgi:tRNA(Ile)-lysidine synthase
MHPFLGRVKKTIQNLEMLQPGDRVVVGVSGGADSIALLHALWEIRRDLHLSLVVAHLDHGLRPEARQERAFVRKVSRELGVPFVGRKVDVRGWQKEKNLALQEAARELRYGFFLDVAKSQKASKIALGHTADDQAESVIMRLLRGSGTRGLAGIPPLRDGIFVRPLIETWREEIEAFLQEKKINYLTDPSNQSLHFLRNRVRHELLPILQQYNPRIRQNLVQMAELFREEEEFWQERIEEKFPSLVRLQKKTSLTLDIPSLMEQPRPLRFRLLRYAIEKIAGNLRKMSFAHVFGIEGLLQSAEPNKSLKIPQGIHIIKTYQALTLTKLKEEILPFDYNVPAPGQIEIAEIDRGMRFAIQFVKGRQRIDRAASVAQLDFDQIDFPLQIRSVRPGDRFQPLGMEGEKKVKDLFIDCKIPGYQRKRIPLLFKGDQLLWVAGLRIDHRLRLKPDTHRILRVELI